MPMVQLSFNYDALSGPSLVELPQLCPSKENPV